MRPQLIGQMKGIMPAAPHRSYILVTRAPPDSQGRKVINWHMSSFLNNKTRQLFIYTG